MEGLCYGDLLFCAATVSTICMAIMPNHIHMILISQGGSGRALRAPTVSTIIKQMKGAENQKL